MSDSLGDLFVRFGGDTRQFDNSMRHIRDQMNQLQNQNRGGGFGSIFAGMTAGGLAVSAITTAFTALTSAIKSAVMAGFEFNSTMQQNETAFTTMLGDAKDAQQLMASIKDFAAKTPLETTDLTQGTKILLGYGVAAENVMPALKMLGDVAQGDKNKMNSLALAFGQVMANGRLMGQEVLQMVNAGFNPLQEISKNTGKSMAQLKKDMEDGAITATMVAQAFQSATSEGGRFNGAMEAQSKTFAGQMSTMRDNVKSFLGDAFKPVFDTITNTILPMAGKAFTAFSTVILAGIQSLGPAFSSLYSAFVTIKTSIDSMVGYTVPWFKVWVMSGWLMMKDWVMLLSGLANVFEKTTIAIVRSVEVMGSAWRTTKAVIAGDVKGIVSGINETSTRMVFAGNAIKQVNGSFTEGAKKGGAQFMLKSLEALKKIEEMKKGMQGNKFDPNKLFNFDLVADSMEDGLKKAKDKVAEQMKSILGEVKSKAESIRDAFDIFSSPKMEKLGWKDLRYRMQKQLRLMEQWKSAMQNIGQRMGTESPIYRATLAQGPQAVGQAMALASMPNKDLLNFANQYNQKQAIGMQFAAQQQAWQMKADNINQNITFNITESTDSDKVVQEVTKKLKLVGVM